MRYKTVHWYYCETGHPPKPRENVLDEATVQLSVPRLQKKYVLLNTVGVILQCCTIRLLHLSVNAVLAEAVFVYTAGGSHCTRKPKRSLSTSEQYLI